MLNQKSEQFIIELRMYLMSKGKNDQQIDDIIEELSDHLQEAEAKGKSVEDITGGSPRKYMKMIGKEMGFDFGQFAGLVPLVTFLLLAYFSIGPAIRGTISLSKTGVWIGLGMVILSFIIYGFFLVNVLPKIFHSKSFYIVGIALQLVLTGVFVVILLLEMKLDTEPFFIATPLQNNLILIADIIIFIAAAIYTKTWFTIYLPIIMAIGPIATRFIPDSINKNPTYIAITIAILIIVSIGLLVFFIRKGKREKQSAIH
ncbi:hypothetical protein CUC15_02335 [Oceanobacillus zhaokaii]|uniref:DUF1129 domain-containing protein n=1 Tax=Oceanobacillus zhaokaii TaxID=2052660 RepID=A0A345PD05_9BACI|nr:hypothetical protein [Oceanobacillus zhaokaii]AXI07885.1 hypothetical protein CUC15_02335 [Oceanobacillus zhaokaii]